MFTKPKNETPSFVWSHKRADEFPAVQQALKNLREVELLQAEHEQKVRIAKTAEGAKARDAELDHAARSILAGEEPKDHVVTDSRILRERTEVLTKAHEIRLKELEAAVRPAVRQIAEDAVSDDRRLVGDVLKAGKALLAACDSLQRFRTEFRKAATVERFGIDFAVAPLCDLSLNFETVQRLRSVLDQFEKPAVRYIAGKGIIE